MKRSRRRSTLAIVLCGLLLALHPSASYLWPQLRLGQLTPYSIRSATAGSLLAAIPSIPSAYLPTTSPPTSASTQIGGETTSASAGARPLSEVSVLSLAAPDVQGLLAEDQVRAQQSLPFRFAQPIMVDITPAKAGTWETLPDGSRLWRLRIQSPGAVSLNLGFTRYRMPPGGRLLLYTPDGRTVRGPFTAADNEPHGQLWSPIVPGHELVIELRLPALEVAALELALTSVNYGYLELRAASRPEWGECNVDVICGADDGLPQVDAWRDEIRSVVVYAVGGSLGCTAVLANNTAQDLRAYLITSYSCLNEYLVPSLVAYWNYQNSWCRPPGDPINGFPGDGHADQFNIGSVWRAAYPPADLVLVELDDPIAPAYHAYWAGWDATAADATSAVGIGQSSPEKRISFENDAVTTTSIMSTTVPGDGTHIRVAGWDLGMMETVSGAPLFNQDHRVVGKLSQSQATCRLDGSTWYGRLSAAWDPPGATPADRLKDWLDPAGTGALTLDGRDGPPVLFGLAVEPEALGVCKPAPAVYSVTVGAPAPELADPVALAVSGQPAGTTATFGANPIVPTGTTTLTIGNTAAAFEGIYLLDVSGQAAGQAATVTVGLDLYTSAPLLPAPLQPANGAYNVSLAPPFGWAQGSFTADYRLQVASSPLFSSPAVSETGLVNTTVWARTPLEGGRCYWWRIQAGNACGVGAWTQPQHFATVRGTTRAYADAESGPAGWTADLPWAITASSSNSPSHSWTDSPHGEYFPNMSTSLTSPVMDLSDASVVFVSFAHRYETEEDYDFCHVEYSRDGGLTWSTRMSYTGQNFGWEYEQLDLGLDGAAQARVRFRLESDGSASADGWYVDDILIYSSMPPAPAITLSGVTPSSGPRLVSSPVTVSGTGFEAPPALQLGATWLPDVTLVSSTTLRATVPAGLALGLYDLTLYKGDCQPLTLHDAYTVVAGYRAYLPVSRRR